MAKRSKSAGTRPALSIVGASPGSEPSEKVNAAGRTFTIHIRGIEQNAGSAIEVGGATVSEALLAALSFDVSAIPEPVLYWVGKSKIVALDFDRDEGQPPVHDEDIVHLFPDWVPQPLAAWATHDCGLRVIFSEVDGNSALALAGAWYQLAPLGDLTNLRVELKTESRHPMGRRETATCGQVFTFAASANFMFPTQRSLHDVSGPRVQTWLDAHGLSFGRHGPEACPWCGYRLGTCNPCVQVDERGVACYRCQTFRSWVVLLDDRPAVTQLQIAARNLVHFPHQRFVLKDARPGIPEELLQPAWGFMLDCANQDRLQADPEGKWRQRVDMAESDLIDVARALNGTWLSVTTLESRRISADRTLSEMPWCLSRTRIDKALSAEPLSGFVPLDTVGYSYVVAPSRDSSSAVLVRRPPRQGEPPPVMLGSKPPDPEEVEIAWCALERALPGLNRGYLSAIILGGIWAQRGISTPPIVCVTGVPGTSKTATVRLGAGMLGTEVGDVLLSDSRDVLRQIGLHLELGRSPILLDEIGRVRGVYERLQPILGLNSKVSFEAKYSNERMTTVRAPIVIAGSTLPRPIVASPELARRSVGFLLTANAPNWDMNDDVANLRCNDVLRPHLDVITSSVWWLLSDAGGRFNFRQYCFDNLGAVSLVDLDSDGMSPEGRDEAVRQLYMAFRNAPISQITKGTSWKGWLECAPGTPNGQLLGELVDYNGDSRAQYGEMEDLKRLDLSEILGFETPRVRLLVRQRGAKWLVKFEEQGVPRGRGCKREDLPPISSSTESSGNSTKSQGSPSAYATSATSATTATDNSVHTESEETVI